MKMVLPDHLWALIYSYDPTYHAIWRTVNKKIDLYSCDTCGGVYGRKKRYTFESLSELDVIAGSCDGMVLFACRACGSLNTASLHHANS